VPLRRAALGREREFGIARIWPEAADQNTFYPHQLTMEFEKTRVNSVAVIHAILD